MISFVGLSNHKYLRYKPLPSYRLPICPVFILYDMMYSTFALLPLTLLILPKCALTRDITFPSFATIDFHQAPIRSTTGGHDLDNIDIVTGSEFAGLTTFANLPYRNCFADGDERMEGDEGYDVAILGAPFDTVSCVLLIHSQNPDSFEVSIFSIHPTVWCFRKIVYHNCSSSKTENFRWVKFLEHCFPENDVGNFGERSEAI